MGKFVIGILLIIFFIEITSAEESDNYPEYIIGVNQNLFPDLTPTESSLALKLIDKDFGEFAKLRVSYINYDDLAKMRKDFNNGRFDFIILPSIEIIKNFEKEQLGEALTLSSRGQFLDLLLVISRNNEGIHDFSDLKNRKISILDNDELTDIYLKTLVYRSGGTDNCFFSKIDKFPTSQRLILQLFFKQTDAIVIFQSQLQLALEMNPVIAKNIKVVDKYEAVPAAIGYFSQNVDKSLQEYIISSLLKFQRTVRGRQLLLLFKTDEYRRANWTHLEPLIKLYNEYKLLKKTTDNRRGCPAEL